MCSLASNSPATCCLKAAGSKGGFGFNRLLLSTEEGGAQPKDYEARMLTDRVRAVGTVWLGQTVELRPMPRPQVRSDHVS